MIRDQALYWGTTPIVKNVLILKPYNKHDMTFGTDVLHLGSSYNIPEGVPKQILNRKWVIDTIQNGRLNYWHLGQKTSKQSPKCM